MSIYGMGVADSAPRKKKVQKESSALESDQQRMALSLHRRREGEKFAREAHNRGQMIVFLSAVGITATALTGVGLLVRHYRKKRS